MFAQAGLDWVFVDAEHGCFTIETIQDVIRTCQLLPVTPIVRVADFQYDLVARALDMGAEGIIFPRVDSPEGLARAVAWSKFPPLGTRGFGLTPPNVGYSTASIAQIMEHQNRETLIVAQVESQAALNCCEELAAVGGVDVLLVGPADLSVSLGVPGEWESPKLLAAIERVIEACRRHGRWPAIHVRSAERAKHWVGRGMRLISCGSEQTILWEALQSLGAELRSQEG
jgi:2-dehydro-3-deoxyglucarate aldolase/4-hydroxy-2-oxoheptanedioate aldolase